MAAEAVGSRTQARMLHKAGPGGLCFRAASRCRGVIQHDIESWRMEVLSMSCISIGRSLEKRKRSPSISSVSLRFGGESGAIIEARGGGGLCARMKESSAVDLTFPYL